MGIFYEQVQVVNRTSKPLTVRYDGQDIELAPNYTEAGERIEGVINMIPKVVMAYALNQLVNMGTEDPLDPSRFESLVGFVEPKLPKAALRSWHETSYIAEPNKELTRVNLRDYLEDDQTVTDIKVRGRRTQVDAATTTPFDLQSRS
jgi:hypothetical protein